MHKDTVRLMKFVNKDKMLVTIS